MLIESKEFLSSITKLGVVLLSFLKNQKVAKKKKRHKKQGMRAKLFVVQISVVPGLGEGWEEQWGK